MWSQPKFVDFLTQWFWLSLFLVYLQTERATKPWTQAGAKTRLIQKIECFTQWYRRGNVWSLVPFACILSFYQKILLCSPLQRWTCTTEFLTLLCLWILGGQNFQLLIGKVGLSWRCRRAKHRKASFCFSVWLSNLPNLMPNISKKF